MKRTPFVALPLLLAVASTMPGCLRTQSEVDVKPVDINLNITGRLELVITDARRTEEQITGSKPKRTVRPEDIGLPPAGSSDASGPGAMVIDHAADFTVLLASTAYAAETPEDREAALVKRMAARHPQLQAPLDSGAVGESHGGMLAPRGNLTPAQKALVEAENVDRAELYRLVAARNKTSIDEVALGYYMARLEHVNKGTWVERYDKKSGRWEWFRWDR